MDVPKRGHVISTIAETYGRPLRDAVAVLSGSLARHGECANLHQELFDNRRWEPLQDMVRPEAEMASWSIVSMWVSAISIRALPASASLLDAECWFFGTNSPRRLTSLLSDNATRKAEKILRLKIDPTAYFQLLPYLLDPHGPGSRLSVSRDPGTRIARARKRAEGVFYTPADIAEYMAAACLDSLDDDPFTVFDPACGTGVFLRAALREIQRRHPGRCAFEIASECLFGTDIDPWPLDATAFVLLTDVWKNRQEKRSTPAELWRQLRLNFACIDTLRIDPAEITNVSANRCESLQVSRLDTQSLSYCDMTANKRVPLSRLFPALNRGPSVVLGNPPYANVGDRDDFEALGRSFNTLAVKLQRNAEIYLLFLEQMIRLASPDRCAGSLVLPLSLACNVGSQFAAARKLISETPGDWRFAFFDREPQALFGEDVKTRNTIITWSRSASETDTRIETGPLRKWRGESRAEMFQTLRFTPIESDIRPGIPKVDGECQAAAFKVLSSRFNCLEQAVKGILRLNLAHAPNADNSSVFVGPTAYNFLNVFLKPPRDLLSDDKVLSEHPLYAISCASPKDALAVFAILTSHLAYWWWHAHGDGFHVNKRFIASLPFGLDALNGESVDKLVASGGELWSKIKLNPIVSLNRGRASLAYTPNGHDRIRRQADQVLADLAGLESAFVDELQQFTAHTVAAKLRGNNINQVYEEEGA